jgi:hypothetical protein
MPRGPCLFRESDVRRAVKATRSSGLEIARVEIDAANGKIAILPQNTSAPEQSSDLDSWLAKKAPSA